MYEVSQDTNPAAVKPWLVVRASCKTVVSRFVEKRFAQKKARQLNYRRSK